MLRAEGVRKELEAEFGVGTREGTLVLTNNRLIFACTNEKEEDLPGENPLNPTGKFRLIYSEVEDLASLPKGSPNVFIPLEAISSIKGHKGGLERPSLQVIWSDEHGEHNLTFTETLAGHRKRNLNNWAEIVENLKSGKQKLVPIPAPPAIDTLEGRIAHVLADMQEKGVLQIEEDVEGEFEVDLDPDEVQAGCDKLAKQGILIRFDDNSGDVYYRMASPLGEDNPSS